MHRTIISGAFHICIIRQIQSLWNGFWKEQKNTFEIAKKHGCANMDKALDRYIIHAVWKRKKNDSFIEKTVGASRFC